MAYDIKEWAVVSGTTGRFLGRLLETKESEEIDFHDIANALNAIEGTKLVRLDPAFEFAAFMNRDASGRTERKPLVAPVDFAVFGMPVYVKPTSIYFCAEMKDEDQKTYCQLVEQGLEIMNRARANQVGIELPSKGVIGALSR